MKNKEIKIKGMYSTDDKFNRREFSVILTSDEIGKSMSIKLGNGEMISIPMDYIYKLFQKSDKKDQLT